MNVLDSFRLDGRLALVTGSSAGLGLAIARGLAQAGARVVLNGRDAARLAQAEAQLKAAEAAIQMNSATTAPGVIHLKPGSRTFGEAWKSTANMVSTSTTMTGHLAMSQTVWALEPTPIGSATALTTGPVMTSPIASAARIRIIARVIRTWTGLSFQKGRPSWIS